MANICKITNYCAKHNYIQCVFNTYRKFSCLPKTSLLSKRISHIKNIKFKCINKNYSAKCLNSCRSFSTKNFDDEFADVESSYYDNNTNLDTFKENNIRSILYPNSNDPVINELKKCNAIQDVINIIDEKGPTLTHRHICQTVLVLWDLQKSFHKQYVENLEREDVETSPESLFRGYTTKITSHKGFIEFLKLVEHHSEVYDVNELSCVLSYLKSLGYNFNHDLVQKLTNRAVDNLKSNISSWNLESIERFTNAIKSPDILRFAYLAVHPIPFILKYLDCCKSSEEFQLITNCLYNIHIVIGVPILEQYKKKCAELLDSGIINCDEVNVLLNIINFLNLFHWSKLNVDEIIHLCKILKPSINKMDANNIISLHQVFQAHGEPAGILEHIQKKVTYLLEEIKYDERVKAYLKLPDLLYCQITTSSSKNKTILEKILSDLIKTTYSYNLLPIYNSLRCLKLTDINMCDLYWKHVSTNLINSDTYTNKLLQICYKYMYFNNNIYGRFRSYYFEDVMLKKLFHMLEHEDAGFITTKFSRILSFIVAFGLTRYLQDDDFQKIKKVVYKLEDFIGQLNMLDCFILSRGLQLYNELSPRRVNDKHYNLTMKIDNILDRCSNRFVKLESHSFNDLNVLCKSYINRKSDFENNHFYKLLSRYNFIEFEELSSRLIKQAAYNFISTNTFVSKFINEIQKYVIVKNEDIFGDVAQKILHMCFLSGSNPKSVEFFNNLLSILQRDMDIMNGLTLLNYCIALSYYGYLSNELIKYVFSMDFLERLDLEIGSCYSKKTYPKRLRDQMMVLNRIVCLDYPQHEIPWFHQKYIEEIISFTSSRKSIFSQDILSTLINITGNLESYTSLQFSPYGYKIDYVIGIDKNNKIVNSNYASADVASTFAILLLDDNTDFAKIFSVNENISKSFNTEVFEKRRNAASLLRTRHLEQLGYNVIEISNSFWNSMYMAEPDAKINYLRNKLRK